MSVRNPHNLRVGSTLYYVPSRSSGAGESRTVTVTKIGHKWATCGDGWSAIRVNLVTLWVDGGVYGSPGRCYLSEATYREQVERAVVWRAIGRHAQFGEPPETVTTQQLRDFAALIGVKP